MAQRVLNIVAGLCVFVFITCIIFFVICIGYDFTLYKGCGS